ncbi:hypothetical protein MPRF_09020 [Mycolicibacterium parafortuitum]|uniref:Uncharacterized protein n=1 Tax=Mycolicibacterium parafortuitum TaxID=39692 RepID=A0A7I7TZA7_MYCPF|nr:hypothetical protein MPRF_09020 [Mycolicibacterium parafortuitum]
MSERAARGDDRPVMRVTLDYGSASANSDFTLAIRKVKSIETKSSEHCARGSRNVHAPNFAGSHPE